MTDWLGLMIGNSRLHWAYVNENSAGSKERWSVWHTDHITEAEDLSWLHKFDIHSPNHRDAVTNHSETTNHGGAKHGPPDLKALLLEQTVPLWIASVVPNQTVYWQPYPNARTISLKDIPLDNLYPTLGIDRALAMLGAWETHQRHVLVIDGGTALTLSGVDARGRFVGGAILPGLGLQLRSLHHQTAALPDTSFSDVPESRWQTNTMDAIRSGVWYGLAAGVKSFIDDWLSAYPHSTVVFTGGDGEQLWKAMDGAIATPTARATYDPYVIFKGMAVVQRS